MITKDAQRELASLGLYKGGIDGDDGPLTKEAVKKFQRLHPPLAVTGIADDATLEKLFVFAIKGRTITSANNNTELVEQIYGIRGANIVDLVLPYKMSLAWEEETTIKTFKCHAKVRDNIDRILNATLMVYGLHQIRELGLDLFGGCFNIRPMRGGDLPSMHSWGIAVDIDPAHNQLKWGNNRARLAGPEYYKFWSIVQQHGGYSMGQVKNYDWMHFQFMPI